MYNNQTLILITVMMMLMIITKMIKVRTSIYSSQKKEYKHTLERLDIYNSQKG